jgi:hypothetical protein
VLILMGTLPFWDMFRRRAGAQAMIRGVNAAVVGLLGAALYNPVWTSSVGTPGDFGIALLGFVLLTVWRAPPLLAVVISARGGIALAQCHAMTRLTPHGMTSGLSAFLVALLFAARSVAAPPTNANPDPELQRWFKALRQPLMCNAAPNQPAGTTHVLQFLLNQTQLVVGHAAILGDLQSFLVSQGLSP